MTALPPAPDAALDAEGRPRFGTWAGSIPSIDLRAGALRRLLHRKRWQYAFVATDDVLVSFVIADLGYAANAFVFVADRGSEQMIFDRGFLALPFGQVRVGDHPAAGLDARFRGSGAELRVRHSGEAYELTARADGLRLDARLDPSRAPSPLTLIAPIAHGRVNVTQKTGSLAASGMLDCGRRFDLAGGFGGLDYTHGLLARETAWRWAFACGRARDGAVVSLNLVEGFNAGGDGENALWLDESLELLPACVFAFDANATTRPWTIRSADGRVDLSFRAWGEHREDRNLGFASSHFVQVAGEFSGRIVAADGRSVALDRLPGVTEDQSVRW